MVKIQSVITLMSLRTEWGPSGKILELTELGAGVGTARAITGNNNPRLITPILRKGFMGEGSGWAAVDLTVFINELNHREHDAFSEHANSNRYRCIDKHLMRLLSFFPATTSQIFKGS